jgi:flagellar hook assembly protein FlgD
VVQGRIRLEAARPNPFDAATELDFALGRAGPVRIDVFDVLGERVARLANETMAAGQHVVRWSGRDAGGRPVGDGIYYVHIRAGDVDESRAVVRIR